MEQSKKWLTYGLALAAGISYKFCDDNIDRFQLAHNSFSMELSKVLVIMFSTLALLQDVWFSVIFCFGILGSTLVGGVTENFWKVVSIIPLVITPYMLYNNSLGDAKTICLHFLIILGGFIVIVSEGILFPEESSSKKLFFRLLAVLLFSLYLAIDIPPFFSEIFTPKALQLIQYVKDLTFLNMMFYGGIGYFGMSALNCFL